MERQDIERAENLRRVYEQNWLHARHVENERLWFTNIYAVVMAGSLVLMSETGLIWPIASFLFGLSFLGFCMCHALRIAFIQHSRIPDIVQRKEWQLRHYSLFYERPEQSVFKTHPSGEVKKKLVSLNDVFYLLYMLGTFGSAILLIQAVVCLPTLQILLEVVVACFLISCYIMFRKYEKRLHTEMGQIDREA